MWPITYRGDLVAIATRSRVYLTPAVEALPPGHPKLRFAAALCLYGRDVCAGAVPGPYDELEGELYARTLVIPDEEIERLWQESDVLLAARFCVPLGEIAAKRRDVAASVSEVN
jgi:hypothetical protein